MDTLGTKKSARKRIGELLVEAGIVKSDQLPKGLEYAQKATDEDIQAVLAAKAFVTNYKLPSQLALRALSLAKQRHILFEQALTELGWQSHNNKSEASVNAKEHRLSNEVKQKLLEANKEVEELEEAFATNEEIALQLAAEYLKLADLYFEQNLYAQAEGFYNKGLTISEKHYGPTHLEVADNLMKLAHSIFMQDHFQECEPLYWRAFQIKELCLGEQHIELAACLENLAELYDVQSQYLEAERYYLSALGIKEKLLPSDDPELSECLKKLAFVSKQQGKRPESRQTGELLVGAGILEPEKVQEGLELAKQNALPIGRALISLNYLSEADLQAVLHAQLLMKDGVLPAHLAIRALKVASKQQCSLEDALSTLGLQQNILASQEVQELLRVADELILAEAKLSPEHLDVGVMCIRLADLHMDSSKLAEAENLYRRGLTIAEKQLGPCDLNVAEVLMRLSELYFFQGKYSEVETLLLKALDIREAALGSNHLDVADTLECLARLHYVQASYKEAGRLYQLSLSTKENLVGSEHNCLTSTLQGRANCYFVQKRYEEAERLYCRALNIEEKSPSKALQPQVGMMLETMGDLFFNQRLLEKAQTHYERSLEVFSKSFNPEHPSVAAILVKLANCQAERGNYEQADYYLSQVMRIRKAANMTDSPDMPAILEQYANVLRHLDRISDAESLHSQAERLRQQRA